MPSTETRGSNGKRGVWLAVGSASCSCCQRMSQTKEPLRAIASSACQTQREETLRYWLRPSLTREGSFSLIRADLPLRSRRVQFGTAHTPRRLTSIFSGDQRAVGLKVRPRLRRWRSCAR